MAYGTVVADVVQSSVTGVSLGAGNATLLKNRLIDAGFTINQRVYVSGTALSAGTYAHDRWKAGASGCTYTFTQGSLGVPIVITITAGSLQQIIEGCNMPDGGTFTLSWTGTAQGRVNGGSYGSSPLAVTGLTAGANCTVEFNTGTLSFPQLEVGSSATGYEYRQYGQELALCQRYCQVNRAGVNGSGIAAGIWFTSGGPLFSYQFIVPFRATPTMTYSALSDFAVVGSGTAAGPSSLTISGTCTTTTRIDAAATGTAGQGSILQTTGSSSVLTFSAEL
ncbi:hypothetical protein UFOVP146_36 [uncultured Caudovirales phage]|uniref:Uncharacterized protein n=1 Tax=uncultured Caudovirales phage TaxID=2100421 RepID=A0A6J7VSY6_9CAUD|nr:hypothetical protein UFOVP146_36 [uncultured Caudovirales phage]